jgi:hypothetical protein
MGVGNPGDRMSGRYRTLALQAVGVAVLAAIVYLAFLRPSDPDPLMGITGPGAAEQAHVRQHKPHRHGQKRHRKPGKQSSEKPGGTKTQRTGIPRGDGATTTLPAWGVTAASPNPSGDLHPPSGVDGGNPGNPHTPPGSQYQDSVARITALLRQ